MLKKIGVILASLIVAFFFMFQPYSLNLSSSKADAQTSNSDTPGKVYEHQGEEKFKNDKVLKQLKKQVNSWYKGGKTSIYKKSDFNWNEAEKYDYVSGKNGLSVPLKANKKSDDQKIFMFIGYNDQTKEIGDTVIMEWKTKDNGVNNEMTIKTMDGKAIAGLKVNAKTKDVQKIEYGNKIEKATAGMIQKDTAHASYWSDVKDCVKNNWKHMPSWAKWACGAGCGSCMFGTLPACGACVGCGGGYLAACLVP
ncbi:hypothetical protein EV207_17311 [Scopulibacillus darangshiensis]|uniref:Uncharacterized protein n=1 Tax=Scopulibacillus darangshiensis TaxID=442528 RepID=A0A4R2NAS2_9BACL|nr:hypothetical protein [Scopulibacillus darangshiensis]TCP18032.1 hypothetical protein EV207_17311 [Scopulibacillus darangshiensis]